MKNSRFLQIISMHVAAGMSIRDAAKLAKCSESNAYTLSRSDEFRNAVSRLRTEITFEAVGKLTSGCTEAIDTLRELLSQDNEPNIRLNASKAILNALPPLSELSELRSRVDGIERQASLRIVR